MALVDLDRPKITEYIKSTLEERHNTDPTTVHKKELLSAYYSPVKGYWNENEMMEDLKEVADGSFKVKNPPEIIGAGYVVQSLEAALWAFYNSDSFEEGVLKAVNLGDDADTTGAIYGQLAGAFYGLDGIPDRFKDKIAMKELIMSYVEAMHLKVIYKLRDMDELVI